MRALIVGATAGVGRALAEKFARERVPLLIAASDGRDLDVMRAHLTLVAGAEIATVEIDALEGEQAAQHICDAAIRFGGVDSLYFPIGFAQENDAGALADDETERLIATNFSFITKTVLRFLQVNDKLNAIVGFGTVAAARGRSSNIVYAASKRALESYFESLRHLLEPQGVKVQFYQLGYVDTQQSYGKKLPFPTTEADEIAREVWRRRHQYLGAIYLPRYWRIITYAVKATPWAIYKKLKF